MKNLLNLKNLKKIGIGALPIIFLFVTLVSGNLWYVKHVQAADTVGHVSVLSVPDASHNKGELMQVIAGRDEGADYDKVYPSYDGTENNSSGKIKLGRTENGEVEITLSNLDITTPTSLLKIDAGGDVDTDNINIILEGTNKINTPKISDHLENPIISIQDSPLKFTGSGSLEINNHRDQLSIKSSTTDASVEFATSGTIKLIKNEQVSRVMELDGDLILSQGTLEIQQDAGTDAIDVESNIIINGGTLNVTGGADGLRCKKDVTISGNSKVDIKTKYRPIFSRGNVTIDGGNVKLLVGSNPVLPAEGAIYTLGEGKITINHGATVEAFNGTGFWALATNNLVIDNSFLWTAMIGNDSSTANELNQIGADSLKEKLKKDMYQYVKMSATNVPDPSANTGSANNAGGSANTGSANNAGGSANTGSANNAGGSANKDGVPKTGDDTSVVPYVLLLVAGVFTVMVANKKTIFDK